MKNLVSVSKLARTLSWTIAAILVLLPFHAVFTTWLGSSLNHLDVVRVWKEIILIIITPFAIWLAWKQKDVWSSLKNSWIVGLFSLYVLLHLMLGGLALWQQKVNAEALVYSLTINLRFIAFFIICYIVASSSRFLKDNWRAILLLPAGVVVVFGILQKFLLPYDFLKHLGYGPETIPAYQTVDSKLDLRRIQSTLRGANPLGAYLALIIPAISLAISSKIAKAVGLVASFMVLFFSYSRSAWIGVTISLLIAAWLSGIFAKKERLVIYGTTFGLVLLGAAFLMLRDNHVAQGTLFHTSDASTSVQSTNEVRSNALRTGARDILYQPFGMGPGTAGLASFRNDHEPRIAENYYLQIGQEVGLVGMALFIAMNLLVALQLWKRKKETLPLVLLASLIGVTLINMLSHAWTDDTLSYLWWGLAGIALTPIITNRQKANGKAHKTKS